MNFKKILLWFLLFSYAACSRAQIPVDALSLWLRADSGLTLKGTDVQSWTDLSNHKHDAKTVTPNFPQLIPNQLNGYPAVRFNGKNTGMKTMAFETFPGKRGALFMVVKINGQSKTSGAGYSNFISTYYGNGFTWQFGATESGFSYYDGKNGINIWTKAAPTEWGINAILRSDTNVMEFYHNGELSTKFKINNNQPETNTLKIGFNDSAEVMNGDIAEIILYDKLPSPEALQTIHQYLAKKYTFALPAPPFWKTGWFYLLLFLFIGLIFTTIIKSVQQKKLKNKLVILERQHQIDKERQRIAREMHDDIGAGLTQMALMSVSAKNKTGESRKDELEDIYKTSQKLIENINEIIWTLNPDNKTLEQLLSYLREQLHKQLEYSGISYQLRIPENGRDILLTNEQQRNMLLITKEIVNNAIKYSNAHNLIVEVEFTGNKLHFLIEDDGIGFNENDVSVGNGLKNIRHRIETLGGELQMNTQMNTGTSFTYSFYL